MPSPKSKTHVCSPVIVHPPIDQRAMEEDRKPDPPQPICRLLDVHKRFGQQHVLKGVGLDFPPGKVTVVLGPSGCGKSVLLKHLIGLVRPDSGTVWFDGERIDRLSESKLVPVRRQFGFLFQHGALFDSMTVGENVGFPLLEHTSLPAAERERRVHDMLAMVGLADTHEKMPASLSGGQRKRVALARAIVLQPRVILYDEPTTGLDPIRAEVINDLIIKLQRELRVTSVAVTHDLGSAFKIADRMVMLYDGRIVAEGTPDEIRHSSDPIVRHFLEGQATEEELSVMDRAEGGAH
ncbi:MAG: ABC transporter ATP-binding protein [Planctomycetota bacterium]|jgi:phospholipid/cholesterol/gamma-HCH transport system ATP-binding protein